ncbi:Fc.00g039500.m01.CDS01 [Cosmosporella sp. VM-42]
MDPFSITAGTLSGISASFRVVEIGYQLQGVREDAQTFIRLVKQVEDDLEHATACRIDAAEILRGYPDHYRKWIVEAIRRTIDVLDDFGKFILEGTEDDKKISLDKRIIYLLRNYPKLVDREKALSFAHTTLLAAVSFMHLLYVQGGGGFGYPDKLSVPRSPPLRNSTPELKRASSQRPLHLNSLGSMPLTPDPSPPTSQPDAVLWEGTPNSPARGTDLKPVREVLHTLQQLRQRREMNAPQVPFS